MKKTKNWMLMMCFSAVCGCIIAALAWLYLKVANFGVTLIWDMIAEYFDLQHYTLIMCLVGGLIVGIFHQIYGPYPESMADAIKRVKAEGQYPYKHIGLTVLAAYLSILFGGAVGPEAGLVCILLGMTFWTKDELGMAREKMEAMIGNNPYISRGVVFKEMCKCLVLPADEIVYDEDAIVWTRAEQISTGSVAGLVALGLYIALNAVFGSVLSVPRLADSEMYIRDRVVIVLLLVVGIAAGYLYLIFKKITKLFFGALRKRKLHIFNAILGGLVLGLIGTALPMTMFSGGSDIQVMQYAYMQYTPYLLILIGVVKLFLTNVCIESGWRGGHFFPVIFAGLSIGYGFASIFETNQVLCVVVVTGALLGTMLQQPIGALALSLIFFPIEHAGWMAVACVVSGCIPVPVPLRVNPQKRGFVYGLIHRKDAKGLPMK